MKTVFSAIFLTLLFTIGAAAQATPTPTPKSTPAPTPAPTPKPTPTPAQESTDFAGAWSVSADAGGQTVGIDMTITQTGTDFTGTTVADIGSGTIEKGKLMGKSFTATLKSDVQGQMVEFKMDGTIEGDTVSGTFTNSQFGSVPFSGTRAKKK